MVQKFIDDQFLFLGSPINFEVQKYLKSKIALHFNIRLHFVKNLRLNTSELLINRKSEKIGK